MRDIEVYNSNKDSFPAHALQANIEEATHQCLWMLHQLNMLPDIHNLREHVRSLPVSPKRIISYESSFDLPPQERITFEHTQIMDRAIKTTFLLGFMLRDLQNELF
jgi:hypothetical protein